MYYGKFVTPLVGPAGIDDYPVIDQRTSSLFRRTGFSHDPVDYLDIINIGPSADRP